MTIARLQQIAIIGTVGVPASYGGFETLVENLALWHERNGASETLIVYCSGKSYETRIGTFHGAELRYIPLSANGAQSILYDMWSMLSALFRGTDTVLVLGVSGTLILPLVRLLSRAHIVTNIDGIEWKRDKWGRFQRHFLKLSEWAAVRFSHEVIADNQAIADHVRDAYDTDCHVIAYGGDHAVAHVGEGKAPENVPQTYALSLCRIEPENNVHMILEAFSGLDAPMVFVGNWGNSAYGQKLKARYATTSNLYLLDPVYDPRALHALRSRASVYVHGHSAGGTNPSLVEMMHFGVPVLAHSCVFNRHSTEGQARYFQTPDELTNLVKQLTPADATQIGNAMKEIARRRYTWDHIGEAYFALLQDSQ